MRRLTAAVAALALPLFSLTALEATPAHAATPADIEITEFAYGGLASGAYAGDTGDGEYAELTNVGGTAQDLTGWTYQTVKNGVAQTAVSLTSLGTVAPGESVILTDLTAADFRAEWGLKSSVKVLNDGTSTMDKGPDTIDVFDNSGSGTPVEALSYATSYLSAKGKSAFVNAGQLAATSTATAGAWTNPSTAGDSEGSWTSTHGAIGSPGASTQGTLSPNDVRTGVAPNPADTTVKINEVDTTTNKVELINTGSSVADVSGWKIKNGAAATYTIPASTTIAAGGFDAIDVSSSYSFSASGDSATVLDGSTQVDTTTWTGAQATSWGRCPDGTGSFTATHAATDGTANDCTVTPPPPSTGIRISEVETNGDPLGDWIELTNTSNTAIDISGWYLADNGKAATQDATQLATFPTDPTHAWPIPSGTTIPAGGFLTVYSSYSGGASYPAGTLLPSPLPSGFGFGFGLGTPDEARIFNTGKALVDGVMWGPHEAGATYQRCPSATQNVQFTDSADAASFTNSFLSSPGAANDCHPPIRINELDANGNNDGTGNDWVELTNIGTAPVDLNGWILTDDKNADVDTITPTTPTLAGTLDTSSGGALLAPGAYVAFRVDSATDFPSPSVSFGLGASGDEVRLYEPGAWSAGVYDDTKRVDALAWGADATAPVKNGVAVTSPGYGASWPLTPATLGRCSDGRSLVVANGTGAWAQTATPTAAAANSCTGLVNATAWPDSHNNQAMTTADNVDVGQNMSGLFYVAGATPAQDYMWGIQNGSSTLAGANPGDGGSLYKLVRDGNGNWGPATGWDKGRTVRYLDNSTGEIDSEGVTAAHGHVFVTSERDNTNDLVSKIAVVQVDPNNPVNLGNGDTDGDLLASHEWDLGSDLGPGGTQHTGLDASNPGDANLGLEGMTFVPDGALTHAGFVDQSTGAAYNPASYPNHVDGGLFFVALEKNGAIYAYAFNSDNTFHLVATIPSGFPTLMDLMWDPAQDALWATCDNTCQGQSSLLQVGGDGAFHVTAVHQRPTGAVDNLNNEGFTVQPASECVNGSRTAWWSDDTDDAGHWLRAAQVDCTAPISGQVAASVTSTVDVQGTTTPATPSASGWYSTPLTVRFTCADADAVLNQPCPAPVDVTSTRAAGSAGRLTDTLGHVHDATVPALNIDTVAPAVLVGGVVPGTTYQAAPTPTCVGSDADSGIATCTVQDLAAGVHHTVTATATDKAGNTASASVVYDLVPPVTGPPTTVPPVSGPPVTVPPVPPVKGKPHVGQQLSVTVTLPSGATVTYQWRAGSKRIKGATGATLKLTRKLRGQWISVVVTVQVPGQAPVVTTLKVSKPVR